MIYGEAFGALILTIIKSLKFILSKNELFPAKCNYSDSAYNPFDTECIVSYDWLFIGCLAFLEIHTFMLLFCLPPTETSDIFC
jgi:hypothetical protein